MLGEATARWSSKFLLLLTLFEKKNINAEARYNDLQLSYSSLIVKNPSLRYGKSVESPTVSNGIVV